MDQIIEKIAEVFQEDPYYATIATITHLLSRYRTLLIVDNLETIDDDKVIDFLHEIPAPTKVIVTTRRRLNISFPIRLIGMPETDSIKLIIQECRSRSIEMEDDIKLELHSRTGGIPLAIIWSIAKIYCGYSIEIVLKQLGQPSSDISRFCFFEIIKVIKEKPSYRILAALAISERPISREDVGYITRLEDDIQTRDDCLSELERLSLIQYKNGTYSITPLVRNFIIEDLEEEPKLRKELQNNWIYSTKSVIIDDNEKTIWIEGRSINVLATYFKGVQFMFEHVNLYCTRREIALALFGIAPTLGEDGVTKFIQYLRGLLEPNPVKKSYIYNIGKFAFMVKIDNNINVYMR